MIEYAHMMPAHEWDLIHSSRFQSSSSLIKNEYKRLLRGIRCKSGAAPPLLPLMGSQATREKMMDVMRGRCSSSLCKFIEEAVRLPFFVAIYGKEVFS